MPDTPLPTDDPQYPDLSIIFPSAERMQRAARDLVGIRPDAGDQRPWLRHDNWPAEHYPLRRDTPDKRFAAHEDYAFVRVEGNGVHEIPVGPIHAGIIEPGHFRFSVMGEKCPAPRRTHGMEAQGHRAPFSSA